jgi:CPA2 family monovalent cation:H+ antiporter-2
MENTALTSILILLAISVGVVATLRHLQMPPILGYLCIGISAGSYALGWLEGNAEVTRFLGEIGLVFLLFTIGLDFSIPQFLAMKETLLGLGGMQMLVGTLSGGALAWFLGIPWQAALIVGGALAMSSTAIAVKQLNDQFELHAPHGRLALGILLFQDLAAVPLLVMIPILAGKAHEAVGLPLLYALAKGITALTVMLGLGRWVLRPLFHEVAAARSPELFTLTVLLVSLTAAWLTSLLGLSLALGAFVAGMMLSETEYRHQIETDIRPFRDVLLGLFFITVGLQLNLASLLPLWPWIMLLVLGLVVGKGLVVALLTRLSGYDNEVACRTGTVLAQGSEFGLALLTLTLLTGLLSFEASQPILAAVVISMLLAPLLIRYNGPLAKALFAKLSLARPLPPAQRIAAATQGFHDHVIICGFGRVGQNMARFLSEEGFDYVALDLEPARIRQVWEAGEQVFYGDATHPEILEAAGLQQAKALVISFGDDRSALKILHNVRVQRDDLLILVRSRDDASLEQLLEAGATEVVPETLEASLMLAFQLLILLEVPMTRVAQRMQAIRHDHYQMLRVFFRRADAERSRHAERHHERLRNVYLLAGAAAVGSRLGELGLENDGVLIVAVRRGGIRGNDPSPDMMLQAGDVLVLGGTPEQLARAEERLLVG